MTTGTLAERIAARKPVPPPEPKLPEWRKRLTAKVLDHGGNAA